MIFTASKPLTIGIELEFQLLDPDSFALTPAAPRILEMVDKAHKTRVKEEFIRSMVEITTGICDSPDEALDDLAATIRYLEKISGQARCVTYAASLHPFSSSSGQILTSGERYREIMRELQEVGRRLITQGLHVHIGMPDGKTAIMVFDHIRAFLPIFLALTTSSPFFEGRDTGLYSYRSRLFGALPRTGIPAPLGTWEEYQRLMDMLKETGAIKQVRDIWWDVRPHPELGTLEVRICDLPCRLDEIIAIGALIQATVQAIMNRSLSGLMHRQLILANRWQAVRYGLRGNYVSPSGSMSTIAQAASSLVDTLSPIARNLGSRVYMLPLNRILSEGTSSDRQRALYRRTLSFPRTIDRLRREFWK